MYTILHMRLVISRNIINCIGLFLCIYRRTKHSNGVDGIGSLIFIGIGA